MAVKIAEDTTTSKIYYDRHYQENMKNLEKNLGKEEKELCFYAQICAHAVKQILQYCNIVLL